MGNSFAFDWEVGLMEWLQRTLGPVGTGAVSFLSAFGEELILIAVMGFLYWCYDKRMGRQIGLNVLMGLVWNPMIKNVFLRRRPYFDHENIKILRVVDPEADIYDISAQGYSFPSGHSTNAATVYGSLSLQLKKKWMTVLAVVLPLLVGLSRFSVGAHYPTDVLAGWAIGWLAIGAVTLLSRRLKNPLLLYGILLLTAVPGVFYCTSTDFFSGFGLLVGFIAAVLLEERKVNFENTRSWVRAVLRILCGGLLYVALNKLLKLPFSGEFLESGTRIALLVRSARYAVIAFVEFGVYPALFRYTARLGGRGKGRLTPPEADRKPSGKEGNGTCRPRKRKARIRRRRLRSGSLSTGN